MKSSPKTTPPGALELHHAMLRAPIEVANRSFRLAQKQLMREISVIVKEIEALDASQPAAQHEAMQAQIDHLHRLTERIQALKQVNQQRQEEQDAALDQCVARVAFLESLANDSTADSAEVSAASAADAPWDSKRTVQQDQVDTLVVDYLLSQGFLHSAQSVAGTRGLEKLVDSSLLSEFHAVREDLGAQKLESAIAWCNANGSRLRRLQSPIEFRLRLQAFLAMVEANEKLGAIQYAQSQLTPLAMQMDNQEARKQAIEDIQEAMATLAYKAPSQCGVEAYSKLFGAERWQRLQREFQSAFWAVYGLHEPSSMYIALHAGLSALNTRACRRNRERKMRARARSFAFQRNEAGDSADSDCSDCVACDRIGRCERAHKRHKQSPNHLYYTHDKEPLVRSASQTSDQEHDNEKDTALDPPNLGHGSGQKRSKRRSSTSSAEQVPVCPTCGDIGAALSARMPFARHPHSRLLCRLTKKVMDEHNPPFVLPNGYVYSQEAIESLASSSSHRGAGDPSTSPRDGAHSVDRSKCVRCIETGEEFALSELKPVYIL